MKTAEFVTDIAAEITYMAAAATADALDSVADTADMVVNSIDRFLDDNFEVVEENDEDIRICPRASFPASSERKINVFREEGGQCYMPSFPEIIDG